MKTAARDRISQTAGAAGLSIVDCIEAGHGKEAVALGLAFHVVSAPDARWGEVPAAFVVVKPGQQLSEAQLCEFLQSRIAKFKMPRRFRFCEGPLPKTGTGKIVKRELRELFWSGHQDRVQG